MHTPTAPLLLAALTTTTLAFPTSLTKRVPANTRDCVATDWLDGFNWVATYTTYIGAAFNNGAGCNDVYNALKNSGQWFMDANWSCQVTSDGNTMITFEYGQGWGADINAALESMYPDVAGGFCCPDY